MLEATIAFHQHLISPLCLGTVQLGLNYGIANTRGQPTREDAVSLIHSAQEQGITLYDTARAYGESESCLGAAALGEDSVVITKCDTLAGFDDAAAPADVMAAVDESIARSCAELKRDTLDYVMLHRASHLMAWGGCVWKRLCELHKDGIIERLGVSVATPDEALLALSFKEVQAIQLPFNLLDQRWRNHHVISTLKLCDDVLVMARSTLLQGVMLLPAKKWPVLPETKAQELCFWLDALVVRYERKNILDLCFAYVRAQTWIHSVVVGMESHKQLMDNIALFELPPLSLAACKAIDAELAQLPEEFLNPALWPAKEGVKA